MPYSPRSLEEYLRETLHTPARLEPWRGAATLPVYLNGQYDFFDGTVGNVHILFLHSTEEPAASVAKKHERALQQHWVGPVAFTFQRITPRTRRRMVSEGLSFVVPGNQVYLPVLGASLREKYQARAQATGGLRPSTQVLFLHALAQHPVISNTPSGLARQLGYTPMAMGQSLDQLEEAGLVRVRKAGRERLFDLAGDPADLWMQAQPLLGSPVSRRRYLVGVALPANKGLACGLSALAGYSTLAEPRVPALALSREQEKGLLDVRGAHELSGAEEADLEIEVWTYKPTLLADGPTVDRLSLYLSLREDMDERVQSALGQMMRGVTW
jgi:DNA-binding transcriptional ArsR family regulator